MGRELRISASVASHVGIIHEESTNHFFANGKFKYENRTRDIQVSLEENNENQLFAVSACMEAEDGDSKNTVSLDNELKKYYSKYLTTTEDIDSNYEKLYELVLETGGLIEGLNTEASSIFAGMVISGINAGIVTMGDTRVYFFRNGNIKPLTGDYKKTQRLLRMGIITDEQAEVLSDRSGSTSAEDKSQVKKNELMQLKEGDIFLLCNSPLLDYLDDEAILYIMSTDSDTGYIANTLLDEILKRQRREDITIQVIKILELSAAQKPARSFQPISSRESNTLRTQPRSNSRTPTAAGNSLRMQKKSKARRIKMLRLGVFSVIIFGVVFGFFSLMNWLLFPPNDKEAANPINNGTSLDDLLDDNNTGGTNPDQDSGGGDNDGSQDDDSQTDQNSGNGPDNSQPDNTGQGESEIYVVRSGDSLMDIARKFYNDPSKYEYIMEVNNIEDANKIWVGQKLTIPKVE